MEQDRPTARNLAIRVLSGERATSDAVNAAARTFEKLDAHLSLRLGTSGYRTLLKRAVMLAGNEYAWLESVYVTETGTLEGLLTMTQAEAAFDGYLAILTHLIELLDTFIGRRLTLRVLQSAWPNVAQSHTVDRLGESNG